MDSGAETGQDIQPEGGILGLIDEDVKSSFLVPMHSEYEKMKRQDPNSSMSLSI